MLLEYTILLHQLPQMQLCTHNKQHRHIVNPLHQQYYPSTFGLLTTPLTNKTLFHVSANKQNQASKSDNTTMHLQLCKEIMPEWKNSALIRPICLTKWNWYYRQLSLPGAGSTCRASSEGKSGSSIQCSWHHSFLMVTNEREVCDLVYAIRIRPHQLWWTTVHDTKIKNTIARAISKETWTSMWQCVQQYGSICKKIICSEDTNNYFKQPTADLTQPQPDSTVFVTSATTRIVASWLSMMEEAILARKGPFS